MQKRLFVGLSFSKKFAVDLTPWIKKIKKTADRKDTDLNWTAVENLHVTLVFLGNRGDSEIDTIRAAMTEVAQNHSAFKLKIRGLGGFPALSQARVLYLGVQRSQNLLDLQSDLELKLLSRADFEQDYSPHMTIARLRNPKSCRDLISPFEHIDLGKQNVCEIVLFHSYLRGPTVTYEKLEVVPLTKAANLRTLLE